MSRRSVFISLTLFIAGALLIQNPFYDQPFLGHFGSYQVVLAMEAHEFVKQGFNNLLSPQSFLMMDTAPLQKIVLIHYPISALLSALLWGGFGGSLDLWGRILSMAFSAGSVLIMYLAARRLGNQLFALASACLLAFSPMTLIYGRSFMNEAIAVFLLVLSFWLLVVWKGKQKGSLLFLAGLIFSLLLTFRLHVIVALPAFLYLIFESASEKRLNSLIAFFL